MREQKTIAQVKITTTVNKTHPLLPHPHPDINQSSLPIPSLHHL